jgi:hypothetical protein
MCIWTAYAGKKEAAPVVYEALRKTEGYWAGFYTGIASCSEGKLYLKKCCGPTGTFAEKFNFADLPGNMAIAHSRTASGGLDNRAQPHISSRGLVALHSQGSAGVFADQRHQYTDVLLKLYAEGCRPRSGGPAENGMREHPELTTPDGKQISAADVGNNAIESCYMKNGGDVVSALREAALPLPGEHCSICLFADKPGLIGFINMNQRICYAFEDDGVYMGTTMESLPGAGMEIPGNSIGYVTAEGTLHLERLGDHKINSFIPDGLAQVVIDYLKENPKSLIAHICDKAVRPHFNKGELDYHALAIYRVMEELYKAGIVTWEESERPYSATGIPGRGFLWSLK